MNAGSLQSIDSVTARSKPSRRPPPPKGLRNEAMASFWDRANRQTREDQLVGREPFKCHEVGHRGGRIRWLLIAPIIARGGRHPVCCGQVMELLPSDKADALRDRCGGKKSYRAHRADDDHRLVWRDDSDTAEQESAATEEEPEQ